MATLISPGVSVSVTDESSYAGAGPGTIPLIVIATGQDKLTSAGDSIAAGTTKENAGKLFLNTSQRELLLNYGIPNFNNIGGNSQHGHPLNEYGLLAAYSYLGISNRAYTLRADIDLSQLQPLDDAPTAAPAGGTYWMQPSEMDVGLYVYNGTRWVKQTVFVSTDFDENGPAEPTIADYAITVGRIVDANVTPVADTVYENKLWKRNGTTWDSVDSTTMSGDVQYSRVYPVIRRVPAINSQTSGSLVVGREYTIATYVTGDDFTNVGAASNATGVVFTATDTTPTNWASPSGSTLTYETADPLVSGDIWIKVSEMEYPVKVYDETIASFVDVEVPLFDSPNAASADYGTSLVEGSLYAHYGYNSDIGTAVDVTAQVAIFRHNGASVVEVVSSHDFTADDMTASIKINGGATITLASADLATAISTINSTLISENSQVVALNVNGSLVLRGQDGLSFTVDTTSGNAFIDNGVYSNWELLSYTASETEPTGSLEDGVLWYSAEFLVDILVNDGAGAWEELSGSLYVQPSQPSAPSNGDLWVDTDQLDDYPVIYKRVSGAWELVDNTDQSTPDGIIFADARPIASGAVDADAPDALAYPAGMLLWNTRYSTRNVKRWTVTHTVDGNLIGDRWVSISGNNLDGSLITGNKAVRKVVVQAMAAAISASEEVRSETAFFNLIAAPGYPELMDEMVTLNVDKKQIAAIIGDVPMTLVASGTAIQQWATNAAGAASSGDEGLVTADQYLALYYPGAALTTNVDGTEVVVPASHAMLRTYAYNDQVAYQWFAPAGLNRGVISNATSVGYLDSEGEFVSVNLSEGLRDVLYTNNINPIRNIPNRGLVAWGQKTRSPIASAMDRVNVARLVNYIRYQADLLAQPFLFEPNDVNTRSNVKTAFDSFMSGLVTLRGITEFLVVCDQSNNTSDRIDRNELWIDLYVIPTRAVEFIYIPIRLQNTGSL